jgi:hypothetical protein
VLGGAFALSALSLVTFVVWELRNPEPMLDMRLFRLPGFRSGTLVALRAPRCQCGRRVWTDRAIRTSPTRARTGPMTAQRVTPVIGLPAR